MSAQFNCPVCNQGFEQKSRLEKHMLNSHSEQAVSARDLEYGIRGLRFPQSKESLERYARIYANSKALELVRLLPETTYSDAADVVEALAKAKLKRIPAA